MTNRRRHRWVRVWGPVIVLGSAFVVLLLHRLEVIHFFRPDADRGIPAALHADTAWYGIYQQADKIGYSRRRIAPTQSGYQLDETTHMRINTMGLVQHVSIRMNADLAADQRLTGFTFTLESSRFDFSVQGSIADGKAILTMNGRRHVIPIETPVYMTTGVLHHAAASDLEPGQTRRFTVFDPGAMAQRPVEITMGGIETIDLMGRTIRTQRLDMKMMGARHIAWVTPAGEVVQETGPLGLTLKKTNRQGALAGMTDAPGQDLTRLVAVHPGGRIESPKTRQRLTLEISGLPPHMHLAGERQTVENGRLTIVREVLPDPAAVRVDTRVGHIAPAPLVQSDHPDIRRTAQHIISDAATPLQQAQRLTRWVYTNLHKRPVVSVPDALTVLTNKSGDCNEHAVLLAALGRAAGIPTRIEAGLVYLDGMFYYHAWNSFYLGRWISADSLMNQMPADVTHIRLISGGIDRQLDLIGIIGNIDIRIVENGSD